MLWLAASLAVLVGGGAQPPSSGGPVLSPGRSIPLEGVHGRIDHLAYDPSAQRLFVAALGNGSLEVIDLKRGERVKSVPGLKEPQGAAFDPKTGRVFIACGGDGTVRAFDAATIEQVGRAEVGEDADNVRLGADGASLVVGFGDGGLAILDTATLKRSGEVRLAGHPESFQIEPGEHGRAFVNLPGGFVGGGGSVAVVDLSTRETMASWSLGDAGRNFPMALDAAGKRLLVGCRRSAKLVVLDTESGRVVDSPTCVGDADDVFVDPISGRVLVIGGDGAVDVFETKDHRGYSKAASIRTSPGARTGLLVAGRGLYVAAPERGGEPARILEYTRVE